MSNLFDICQLSEKFYQDYPKTMYPEILNKEKRPYVCLTFKVRDYYVCIPYRSNVPHKHSYQFKFSRRSKIKQSGLDYKKIIIIQNEAYLELGSGVVDNDEYQETRMYIKKIISSAEAFIDVYINHIKGIAILHSKEFDRRYAFSTLQYFHTELGL